MVEVRAVRLSAVAVNVRNAPEFEWHTWQSNQGRCANELFLAANEGDSGRTIRCTLLLSHSGDHEYRHGKPDGSYLRVLWREPTATGGTDA